MKPLGDPRAQEEVNLLKRHLERLCAWSSTTGADHSALLSDVGEVKGDPIIVLIIALMEVLTEEHMGGICPTLDRVFDHIGAPTLSLVLLGREQSRKVLGVTLAE